MSICYLYYLYIIYNICDRHIYMHTHRYAYLQLINPHTAENLHVTLTPQNLNY